MARLRRSNPRKTFFAPGKSCRVEGREPASRPMSTANVWMPIPRHSDFRMRFRCPGASTAREAGQYPHERMHFSCRKLGTFGDIRHAARRDGVKRRAFRKWCRDGGLRCARLFWGSRTRFRPSSARDASPASLRQTSRGLLQVRAAPLSAGASAGAYLFRRHRFPWRRRRRAAGDVDVLRPVAAAGHQPERRAVPAVRSAPCAREGRRPAWRDPWFPSTPYG